VLDIGHDCPDPVRRCGNIDDDAEVIHYPLMEANRLQAIILTPTQRGAAAFGLSAALAG
jgi:hypothetical protein